VQAFSACKTSLDIQLFSSSFADAKTSEKYQRVTRVFNTLGFELVDESTKPKYRTQIELGLEREENRNILLSHIQVTNRAGDIVFEDYRSRTVQADSLLSPEQMLKFTARHISRVFPLCD